jgi:hypothetical protein
MTITEVQLSTKERFDIAMREIRSAGVVARRNIMTCCRSCYDAGVADTQPIIWHYGGQGHRLDFNEDLTGAAVYFNHNNLVGEDGTPTQQGRAVVEHFETRGFEVDWDGTEAKTIIIKFED